MNRPAVSPERARRRARSTLSLCGVAIAVTLVGLIFLTGCNVQAGVDTNVNADGSGTIGMRLVADKELQDALSGAADGLGGQTGADTWHPRRPWRRNAADKR